MSDQNKNQTPDRFEDNYLACRHYAKTTDVDANRIAKFTHDNGEHYFVWLSRKGDVLMRSEGYPTTAARDNGAASVVKNREDAARYSITEIASRFFVILKAGNHQEIARSCPYDSEEAARNAYPVYNPNTDTEAETVVETVTETVIEAAPIAIVTERVTRIQEVVREVEVVTERVVESTEKENDYLPCGEYRGHKADENGIATFQHSNGQYYFVWYDEEGNVLLRSEGFGNDADLQSELALVLEHCDTEERYTIIDKGGYKMAILSTPSGQEIGRSCLEKIEEDAPAPVEAFVAPVEVAPVVIAPVVVKNVDKEDDYLACQDYRGHADVDANGIARFTHKNGQMYFVLYSPAGDVLLRSEGFKTEEDLNVELDLVLQYRNDESRYTIVEKADLKMKVLKTPEGREIGRSCLERVVVAVAPPAPVVIAAPIAVAAVAAVAAVVAKPEVDIEDDYLACAEYRGHGPVSDNGITTFKHSNGQFYFVWYDAKGNVLLRSEGFKTEADLKVEMDLLLELRDDNSRYSVIEKAGLKMRVLKTAEGREVGRSCLEKEVPALPVAAPLAALAAVAAVVAAPVVEKVAYTPPPKDKEDDYLACEEYAKRGSADNKGIVRFRHPNGKKYFVWYDKSGDVLLRSEGFTTNADLERELNAVLRRRNKDENFEVIERNGYRMRILRDERGREVGRSCLDKIVAPVAVPVAAVAAAAMVAAAPVVKEIVKEIPKIEKKAAVAAKVETPVVEAGMNWWPWLLGALAIAGLLFFLLRTCKKPETAAIVPAVVEAPADTTVAAVVPVAPAVSTCNCAAATDVVFKPNTGTPKSLSRLGTNPEFGNSHGITTAEFFAKLTAASKNKGDKAFLDRVYKGMGYANGFADAKAEQFSEASITPGTTGNMGTSKQHRTIYATLNAQGQDLLAFKIKSANGCDLHFMKTCGNHFFFCPN